MEYLRKMNLHFYITTHSFSNQVIEEKPYQIYSYSISNIVCYVCLTVSLAYSDAKKDRIM